MYCHVIPHPDACLNISKSMKEKVMMRYTRQDLSLSSEPSPVDQELENALKGSEEEVLFQSDVVLKLAGEYIVWIIN